MPDFWLESYMTPEPWIPWTFCFIFYDILARRKKSGTGLHRGRVNFRKFYTAYYTNVWIDNFSWDVFHLFNFRFLSHFFSSSCCNISQWNTFFQQLMPRNVTSLLPHQESHDAGLYLNLVEVLGNWSDSLSRWVRLPGHRQFVVCDSGTFWPISNVFPRLSFLIVWSKKARIILQLSKKSSVIFRFMRRSTRDHVPLWFLPTPLAIPIRRFFIVALTTFFNRDRVPCANRESNIFISVKLWTNQTPHSKISWDIPRKLSGLYTESVTFVMLPKAPIIRSGLIIWA